MTEKQLTEVIEGNKLIAEFMGFPTTRKEIRFGSGKVEDVPRKLEYHTSWDWLMPIVEKISKLPLLNHDNTPCTDPIDTCYPITFNMPDREQGGNVLFRFKGFSLHSEKTLIGAAWKAVVEVAEYHLNQNKQS